MMRAGSARALALAPALALVLLAGDAPAHTFAPSLLSLREEAPGSFLVRWTAPAGAIARPAAEPRWPDGCRYQRSTPFGGRLACAPGALPGARLAFGELDGEALVHITWLDGSVTSGAVTRGQPLLAVPARPTATATPGRYLLLGVEHILGAVDHLLFILGLLLLVRRLRALALALSAFTVGHSLTLALAVLGVVTLPAAPVEALIALSLVLLGLELAHPGRPTLARRWPALLAFGFGLAHGLGFAGALAAVGLPRAAIPLALFSFNAGVELGQLAVVALLVGAAALVRPQLERRPRLSRVPVYLIGSVGVSLFVERVLAFWEVAR